MNYFNEVILFGKDLVYILLSLLKENVILILINDS